MVIFHPDKFVIEVVTAADPVESWLETQNEMLDALQSEDIDLMSKRPHYLALLRNMLPDLDTAKKMTK